MRHASRVSQQLERFFLRTAVHLELCCWTFRLYVSWGLVSTFHCALKLISSCEQINFKLRHLISTIIKVSVVSEITWNKNCDALCEMSPHKQFIAHSTAVDATFKFSSALPSIYSSQKTSLQSKWKQNSAIVHRLHHRGFGKDIITYKNQYSCNCKISSALKKLVLENNYSVDSRRIVLRVANSCKREVQEKVKSLKVGEIWLWRCAAATLTATVVQLMTCQDIAYAISSRTQSSLVDFRFTECQAPSDARVGFSSNVRKLFHSAGNGVTLTRPALGTGGKQVATIRMNKGLVTRRQVQFLHLVLW